MPCWSSPYCVEVWWCGDERNTKYSLSTTRQAPALEELGVRQVRQGDVRTRGERAAARVAQRAPLQRTHTRGGGAKGRGQTTQRSNATPRKTNQRTRRTPPLKGAPMRWMKSPNACSETNGAPERGLKQPTKTCYLPSPANREVARTKPRSFSLAFDASEERRESGHHSLSHLLSFPFVPIR